MHALLFIIILFFQLTDWLLHLKVISSPTYQSTGVVAKIESFLNLSAKVVTNISNVIMIAIVVALFVFVEIMPDFILYAVIAVVVFMNLYDIYEIWKSSGKAAAESALTTELANYEAELKTLSADAGVVIDTVKTKIESYIEQELLESRFGTDVLTDAEKLENAIHGAVEHALQLLHLSKETTST